MARYSTNDNPTSQSRCSRLCIYNTPGSYTWTVPTSVNCATFELWGAGGGGGARCCCDCYHQGQGGSGGIYAAMTIPVTAGDSYSLTVPAGGNYCAIGTETSHWCCYGGDGAASIVTGTNITYLCAPGGGAGQNMCFAYCLCGDLNTPFTWNKGYTQSSATGGTVSCASCVVNYCNEVTVGTTAGGCHRSSGWLGMYTDGQTYYYPSYAGGTSFGNGVLRASEYCCTNWIACANCSQPGGGGAGAIMMSCQCMQGGVGRNGLIQIRF
jgi:hypothetical protein